MGSSRKDVSCGLVLRSVSCGFGFRANRTGESEIAELYAASISHATSRSFAAGWQRPGATSGSCSGTCSVGLSSARFIKSVKACTEGSLV
jgi:hypothetical protein